MQTKLLRRFQKQELPQDLWICISPTVEPIYDDKLSIGRYSLTAICTSELDTIQGWLFNYLLPFRWNFINGTHGSHWFRLQLRISCFGLFPRKNIQFLQWKKRHEELGILKLVFLFSLLILARDFRYTTVISRFSYQKSTKLSSLRI